MVYANKLRELRDRKGLTNHELAALSGVPESTLCRILSGQTDNPGIQTVCDIVRALDGDMNEVCGFTAPPKPNLESTDFIKHVMLVKDRWLRWMFVYCVVLTVMVIMAMALDFVSPAFGYIR